MPAYAWSCALCNASNQPGVDTCSKCNFPAECSAIELELARSSGVDAVHIQRDADARTHAQWKTKPLWVRTLYLAALGILVLGILLAKFAPLIAYNVAGLLLALAAFVLLALLPRVFKGTKESAN